MSQFSSSIDANTATNWYALYTRHQHEKRVAQILTMKGFQTFLPLYAKARRWKDRMKLLHAPLFPCYVFMQSAAGPHFGGRKLEIISTPGVHAFVSNSGHAAIIPSDQVESIRRATESGSGIEPHPILKCGQRVRIRSGSLAGIEGVLSKKKNIFRLVLSVEMLGSAAAVEVDSLLVEQASPAPANIH